MTADGEEPTRGQRERNQHLEFALERGKGFLTARDKRWLIGGIPDGQNANNVRQYRSTVRRRVKNAIQDFSIIQNYLAPDDLDLIFDQLRELEHNLQNDEDTEQDSEAFLLGARGVLAILYEGLGRETFIRQAEEAIGQVEAGTRYSRGEPDQVMRTAPPVDVEITVPNMVNMGDLAEKYAAEMPVEFSNAEVAVILDILQRSGADVPESEEEFLDLLVDDIAGDRSDLDEDWVRERAHLVARFVDDEVNDLNRPRSEE